MLRAMGPLRDKASLSLAIKACGLEAWQTALAALTACACDACDADVVTYSAIISCGWHMASALLLRMSAARKPPNRITFGEAISACERASQWSWAIHFLDQMRSFHVSPNQVACSAAISACEKSSHWQAALLLFSSFARLRVEPDSRSYNPLIAAANGMWQLAWHLFSEMPKFLLSPDSFTYTAAINATSQWQLAALQMSVLDTSATHPRNAAVAVYGIAGRWEIALGVSTERPDCSLEGYLF